MNLGLDGLPRDPVIKAALVDPSCQNAVWVDFLDEIDRCNWARLSMSPGAMLPFSPRTEPEHPHV